MRLGTRPSSRRVSPGDYAGSARSRPQSASAQRSSEKLLWTPQVVGKTAQQRPMYFGSRPPAATKQQNSRPASAAAVRSAPTTKTPPPSFLGSKAPSAKQRPRSASAQRQDADRKEYRPRAEKQLSFSNKEPESSSGWIQRWKQQQEAIHQAEKAKTATHTKSQNQNVKPEATTTSTHISEDDGESEDVGPENIKLRPRPTQATTSKGDYSLRPMSASAGRREIPTATNFSSDAAAAARPNRPLSANAQHRLHGGAAHGELPPRQSSATRRYFQEEPKTKHDEHKNTQSDIVHCTAEQREYLARLLVASAAHRRGLPDMYTFGKVIGVGSFGTVRLAHHKLTGQQVAIKTYERAKMKDPQQWKRVQQEARVMEKLSNCALICRYFEAFETSSPRKAHLIMEHLPGGSLCSYVKSKRKLPEAETQKLMFQLALSIDHMHALSIVHRDIKLENILFVDESHKLIRIIDFGFSTRCAPERRLRLFCGTPSYMPPEIVRRSEYRGKPIDIWSFGVVIYACLAGYFPFAARSQSDLYRKILRGTFRMPENLSQSAATFLQATILVDVNRRFTAAQARRHTWLSNAPNAYTVERECTQLGPYTRSKSSQDDIHKEALTRMQSLGVDRDAILRSISQAEHSPISSCYYLLLGGMQLRSHTADNTVYTPAQNLNPPVKSPTSPPKAIPSSPPPQANSAEYTAYARSHKHASTPQSGILHNYEKPTLSKQPVPAATMSSPKSPCPSMATG